MTKPNQNSNHYANQTANQNAIAGLEDPIVIYADSDIVVISKPGGMLAVPGRGLEKQDCVSSRLQKLFPDMIAQPSVHRLDMFTTGLMVYAMTSQSHRHLSQQFEQRLVAKQYTALLEGDVAGATGKQTTSGEISLAFRLDTDNRPHQIYDPLKGKLGTTLWQKLEYRNGRSRMLFTPLTGRTHQLRLHSAHPLGLGCPIVGDSLYGNGQEGDRLLLHACRLEFNHPKRDCRIIFCLPPSF